jgi:plastocyanin
LVKSDRPNFRAATLVGAALFLSLSGCGDSPSEPSDPGPPVQTNTVTITAAGASPRNVEIALGSRVRFINNDSRAHDMTSDEHPDHLECPDLNQVGVLLPGQSRETGNLVIARTCGFHDHNEPNNNSLRGVITAR